MIAGGMDRFDPLSEAFCASAKGKAVLAELAQARPWRRGWRLPFFLYLSFLRRWTVSYYVVVYSAVAVRDPWTLLIAGAASIAFEALIVPKSDELRLSDDEYVRFVLSGKAFAPAMGYAEARKTLLRLVKLLAMGIVVASPLWWLAWLNASGTCETAPAADPICRYAEPGAQAFRIWFGFLMFGPLAFASRYSIELFPIFPPDGPNARLDLRRWRFADPEDPLYDARTEFLIWFVNPLLQVAFIPAAMLIGSQTTPLPDPVVLAGIFFMGSAMPMPPLRFYADWKGSMVVRDFIRSPYGIRRTQLLNT